MESPPVLRQQSQNKMLSDFQRMKNEQNKQQADPKASKLLHSRHLSNKDGENKDPLEFGQKVPLQPGVSRLPVLAKSLRFQTPSDFQQSHLRWEEKPLAGKAKKKRPCTRPVPFNLSQPKTTKNPNENKQPLPVSQSRTHAHRPENNLSHTKPMKLGTVLNSTRDLTKSSGKSHGKMTDNTPQRSRKSAFSNPLKTSASSIPCNTMHQNEATSAVQHSLGAEVCLESMNLLSLKEPSKASHAGQNALTMQGNPSKALNDKSDIFQPNHAALLSILRNEGVGVTNQACATPQTKSYNYLPRRVSVMKSQQKAGPSAAPVRSVQFSPDASALQSILLNEGVKVGGPMGATPRNTVCPPGRGTSIYTAQRVPVKKKHAEATGGPVALKEAPLVKWTPQRVCNTKHQPMSAMKWHQSTQQSPYFTPGRRNCKSKPQPRHEEVVQRLFYDSEDARTTNVTDKDPETQAEQSAVQVSSDKLPSEQKEMSRTSSDDEEQQEMFLQTLPRESVIFFSTGKKLIRAPHLENQESSAQQNQHGPLSSEQRKVPTAQNEMSVESELGCRINPSVQNPHRDLIVQKSSSVSPALAILRKRLPPLEELRLDEEVAIYTSVCVPASSGFLPPQPRCGNPLASILHFDESTKFVPVDFDLSSGSVSPRSSPLHDR